MRGKELEQTAAERNHTYTILGGVNGFASLPTDPEVGGATVHDEGKFPWRGTDFDSGKVTDIATSAKGRHFSNSLVRREMGGAYSMSSPIELGAVGVPAFVTELLSRWSSPACGNPSLGVVELPSGTVLGICQDCS